MTSSIWTIWVFCITGIATILVGFAILVWALIGDRSRGRKRCPACWYDMSAVVGLRCPECGRDVKSEREFLRPRRRWRSASLACFILLAGIASVSVPFWRNDTWIPYTPTWFLVRIAPLNDALLSTPSPLDREVFERLRTREMSESAGQVFFERYFMKFPMEMQSIVQARAEWPADADVWVSVETGPVVARIGVTKGPASLQIRARLHGASEFKVNDTGGRVKVCLGRAAPGPLVLDLELGVDGRTLWRGTRASGARIVDPASGLLSPRTDSTLDEAVQSRFEVSMFRGSQSSLFIRDRGWRARWDSVAIGLDVELLKNGRVVAAGEYVARDTRPFSTTLGWESIDTVDLVEKAPAQTVSRSDTWEVRLKGNPLVALRDFHPVFSQMAGTGPARVYWSGEVVFPVKMQGTAP